MKIGFISDTHGSLSAWHLAYAHLAKVDWIVHCGDVLYHGPRNPLPEGYDPQGLAAKLNALSIPMTIVRGNCDADVDQMLLEYPLESPYVHMNTPEVAIFAHHGHGGPFPERYISRYRLVVSGHTHLPGIRHEGATVFLNPGSPSLPKNDPTVPTVAVLDGRQLSVLDIRTGRVLQSSAI